MKLSDRIFFLLYDLLNPGERKRRARWIEAEILRGQRELAKHDRELLAILKRDLVKYGGKG